MYDRDSGRVIEGMAFESCRFVSCALSVTRDPSKRTIARDLRFVNCEARGVSIYAAAIEDVEVDGLKTNGTLHCWATVFKHVAVRGKIGTIMFSDMVSPGKASVAEQRA